MALTAVGQRFGEVDALREFNLTVPHGSVTVLLGPNGAGKTTATRIITGALSPSSGIVRTFGLDPNIDGEEVRRRCGVVSAKPALYDRLSGHDNLAYAAELYGLGRGPAVTPKIRDAAERFGIEDALSHQVGGYSTGMKTRLALARSVLHSPELLLFDEPTSGLDPESSHAVLEMIRSMTGEGITVVMCTHLLLEAEGLAEQIVVMESGTALVAGPPSTLIRQFWPTRVVRMEAEPSFDLRELEGQFGIRSVSTSEESLSELAGFRTAAQPHKHASGVVVEIDDNVNLATLLASLVSHGVPLTRFDERVPSLEDLYFAVRRRHGSGVGTRSEDGGRRLAPDSTNGAAAMQTADEVLS